MTGQPPETDRALLRRAMMKCRNDPGGFARTIRTCAEYSVQLYAQCAVVCAPVPPEPATMTAVKFRRFGHGAPPAANPNQSVSAGPA